VDRRKAMSRAYTLPCSRADKSSESVIERWEGVGDPFRQRKDTQVWDHVSLVLPQWIAEYRLHFRDNVAYYNTVFETLTYFSFLLW